MGHLAIVNSDTIQSINDRHPYISIGGKLENRPYKTISDLFADALGVRDGDIIFTWMINGKTSKGVGFDRYYIANGSVVFDSNDLNHPIKIGVRQGYLFTNAVSEEEALYLFRKHLLWNAIGKKSLNRGRSLSHQTPDEDEQLLSLLRESNPGESPRSLLTKPDNSCTFSAITINNFSSGYNPIINSDTKLGSVPVNGIIWNKGNKFLYEKTLEAFLCETIDQNVVSFCSLLGYPDHHIKWFGNYLPYGVAGKNIDLVCELVNKGESIIVVIELKNNTIGYRRYKKIIDEQLGNYGRFVADAFRAYRGDPINIENVVLTHSPRRNIASGIVKYRDTKWIVYDIDPNNREVSFARLL